METRKATSIPYATATRATVSSVTKYFKIIFISMNKFKFGLAQLHAPMTSRQIIEQIRNCERAIRNIMEGDYKNSNAMIRHFENKIFVLEQKVIELA